MNVLIGVIIAYLLGSLSVSILLSKIMKYPDPRTTGSGNAGATNILRTVGRNPALLVVVGDALKGLIAVWIGLILGIHGGALGLVALAAVLGHIFPLYFKFKGGRGVATALGSILGLSFIIGLLAMVAWAGVAYLTRYASLASIISMAVAVVLTLLFATAYTFPVFLIAILVIWKHQDNIQRLRSGNESKLQF